MRHKDFNRQNYTLYAMLAIIILSLLTYFGLILFRVIDTSMQEKIHRYLISREGQLLIRAYIALVIFTLIITFWRQARLIFKYQVSIFNQLNNLIIKKFIAKLKIRKL